MVQFSRVIFAGDQATIMADQQSVIDKSLRSVFGDLNIKFRMILSLLLFFLPLVGNIPYDVTEEKLKDIFNEVGPVVSFK